MPQQISFGDEYVTVPTPGRSPVLPYSVRVSSRARRVRLVMSPREGLVVVVPRWFRKSSVAEILEEKREWIARMHEQHREQRKIRPSALDAPLPRQIRLSAAQRTWQVRYKSEAADTVRVHEQNGVLTLHGAVWDVALCHEALRRWLHRTAKRVFANMLDRVSEETGLR
ncbi:MAG: DUF45 domain-containing protein [Rickettsiales bacterium]|nr:DUF45 domain-containing protein [Rickettsiales bacterium]